MTQTIDFTESGTELDLDPVWRASPLVFTGDEDEDITIYRAQLWRRPSDIRDEEDAIATTYAEAAAGTVTLAFSATQMDFSLIAGGELYDDVYIVFTGMGTDGAPRVQKGGWLRVQESGNDPDGFVISDIELTVTDDVATFNYGGNEYSFPVAETTPTIGEGGWELSVVDDILILTKDGVSYSVPVVEV